MDSLKTQTMASLMFSCMAAKLQVTQVKQCRVSKQQRDTYYRVLHIRAAVHLRLRVYIRSRVRATVCTLRYPGQSSKAQPAAPHSPAETAL